MIFLCHIILWFIFYSIVGWIYETALCSITQKRFVNRGFLNGPYCPIYGLGAVLILLSLGWIHNPILLFLAAVLVTGILEYFSAWILEVLFHAKWWDYSEMKFNLHGRVCLAGAVIFGLFSVLLVKVLHPFISIQTNRLPDSALISVSFSLFALLLADAIYTIAKFANFNEKLKAIHTSINEILANSGEYAEKTRSFIENTTTYLEIRENIKSFTQKMNWQEKRLLKAFPRFRPTSYNEALLRVREYFKSIKNNHNHN